MQLLFIGLLSHSSLSGYFLHHLFSPLPRQRLIKAVKLRQKEGLRLRRESEAKVSLVKVSERSRRWAHKHKQGIMGTSLCSLKPFPAGEQGAVKEEKKTSLESVPLDCWT